MRHLTKIYFTLASLVASLDSAWALASRPDPNSPQPPFWVQWGPMVGMIVIFYFILIRPQMRQKRERQNLLDSLKKGDKILTTGGFFATVVNVGPQIVEVKLNEETKVKMQRSAVAEIVPAQAVEAKETGAAVPQ